MMLYFTGFKNELIWVLSFLSQVTKPYQIKMFVNLYVLNFASDSNNSIVSRPSFQFFCMTKLSWYCRYTYRCVCVCMCVCVCVCESSGKTKEFFKDFYENNRIYRESVRDFGPVTYPSKSCFFCSCTNICFVSGKQHLLKGGANHSSETSDTSHREPIVFRLCRNPVSSWNLSVRVLDMWFAPEIILSFLIYLTNLAICRQFSQQSISAFVITTFDISIL